VVTPGEPAQLAKAISGAFVSRDVSQAERAAAIATHFSFPKAMAGYSELIQKLLRDSKQPEPIS
jgi:hypothetical protein